MSTPTFLPLGGNRDCENCVTLARIASENGDALTFVREAHGDDASGVRVYVHPPDVNLDALPDAARDEFRGPWFPACPKRCEVRPAFA